MNFHILKGHDFAPEPWTTLLPWLVKGNGNQPFGEYNCDISVSPRDTFFLREHKCCKTRCIVSAHLDATSATVTTACSCLVVGLASMLGTIVVMGHCHGRSHQHGRGQPPVDWPAG